MAKLWGGRFTKGTDKAVEDFTSSIAFDARMYAEDIAGSKAHATMLAKQNIISDADRDAIVEGLTKIKGQIDKGEFPFSIQILEQLFITYCVERIEVAIGKYRAYFFQ